MARLKGTKNKKKDLSYMPGCELCEVGLIKRVDEIKEEKQISVSKACKEIAQEIIDRYGVSLFSQSALRQRYGKILGKLKRESDTDNSEQKYQPTI